MFKVLNPYVLIAIDEIPIVDIQPGPTSEETVVELDPDREEVKDQKVMKVTWAEMASIRYDVKLNEVQRHLTVPEILVEFLQWVERETRDWKDPIPVRPWKAADKLCRWFSPYLRVSKVAELREGLAADIALLKQSPLP